MEAVNDEVERFLGFYRLDGKLVVGMYCRQGERFMMIVCLSKESVAFC